MTAIQFLHGVETIEVASATQPIQINDQAIAGIVGTADDADPSIFPLDTPVLLTSAPQQASKLGVTGTLLAAVRDFYAEGGGACIVTRVASAVDPEAGMTNVIGDANAKTGLYSMLTARALTGVMPKTIIAPGFTSARPVAGGAPGANPVSQAALIVAGKLRGRHYASTPSTSESDAVAWREDFDSDRLLPIYPNVMTWDPTTSAYVQRPAEAAFAGLTARVHRDNGFWFSPSNFPFNSVGGISTPIDWASGDADCMANILNGNDIATVINMGAATGGQYGGWRRWGNRVAASDTNWEFECVRTTEDAIYEAIDEVSLWMVDKPPSKQLLLDATKRLNDFFAFMKNLGALVGGRAWLDPEDNPEAQMANGVFCWRIDPEAPAPMEHIIYYAQRNASYYSDEIASLASMVAASVAS